MYLMEEQDMKLGVEFLHIVLEIIAFKSLDLKYYFKPLFLRIPFKADLDYGSN
jgi:hypothetical protein